jgi:hypothetical protein
MHDLRAIARALGGEVSGHRVMAPGPNHSPGDRSLAVEIGKSGKILVNTFSPRDDQRACFDYVTQKLGLPMHVNDTKVIPATERFSKRKLVAEYDYTEHDGTLLYQVQRFEPKDFRQRRPDGNGGWTYSRGDRTVLYRWPELAKYPDGTVFICEGEKDADRVASLGLCATTISGGAKWTEECIAALAGRDILILEDVDAGAGNKRAAEAAAALHGRAKSVRVVRLPGLDGHAHSKDVSDWLDADLNRGADELAEVCLAAPVWAPNAPEIAPNGTWRDNVFTAAGLRTMTFAAVQYVLPSIIPEGVTILAGRPKIGKSWLALDIALAISGGRFVLGDIHPAQGDVLYAALEDNKRRLWKRIRKILGPDVPWPTGLTLTTQWRRLDAGGAADIKDWAQSVAKPRLVILDTLAGVRPDRNSRDTLYDGDYRALRELHAWSNEIGIAVLVLTHTRKMEADDPIDTISGSLGLAGCADTSAILARTQKGTTLYLRGRDVEEQEYAVLFNAETCRWTIQGDAAEVQRSYARGQILTALTEATDLMTPVDLTAVTGLTRNIVDQRLHHMVRDGEIIKVSRGRYAHAQRTDLIRSGEP